MKILIIQQKMIGDVLTSSILCTVLRKEYPDAEIHYLINSNTLPVVENHPDIDKLVLVTPEIQKKTMLFYSFLKKIKEERYKIIVDVYSKWSSNFITLFSSANIKIGQHKWYTSFFYNNTVKSKSIAKTNKGLAIENRLRLIEPICKNIPEIKPKIYLTPEEIKRASLFLNSFKIDASKPLFMISVLGSGVNKTYPFSYMAKIIDSIVQTTQGSILFNYIPKQKEEAKTIYNLCTEKTQKHIYFNVFGKSLREFIAISYHCDAVIGNEGGAINIAKAINKPTFAIFSPWILKEAWNMFDDGVTNESVHLKDFKPHLYENKKLKDVKKEAALYYKEFNPEFIIPKLNKLLQTIL